MALLAASGGDTVKLFDASAVKPSVYTPAGDPCALSFTPSQGSLVNSVKWNHTNLVVASAGDDKKISLWRKNGNNMGTIPVAGTDSGDNIEVETVAQFGVIFLLFALGLEFSTTKVFKFLMERNSVNALHGQVIIGTLIL